MAYSDNKKYIDKLRENLTCAVCMEVFNFKERLPRVIPCQHNMCHSCLEGLLTAHSTWVMPCPICRELFEIPRDDVSALPANLVLKGLLDVLAEEEKNVGRPKKRVCSEHSTQEVIQMCLTCKVELCLVCVKLSASKQSHRGHHFVNIQYAIKELRKLILEETIPSMNSCIKECKNITKLAQQDLDKWQKRLTEVIDARANAFIADINQWRDGNNAIVQELYSSIKKKIKYDFEVDHVKAISQEVKVQNAPVSYDRLEELRDLKAQLERILAENIHIALPEGHLTEPDRLQLGELIIGEEQLSSRPKPQTKALNRRRLLSQANPPPRPLQLFNRTSPVSMVASLKLMEQGWLRDFPMQVNDSSSSGGGSNHDVVLLTETSVVKYELINKVFCQIWKKPLPLIENIDYRNKSNNCYNVKNHHSKQHVFTSRNGNIVLRHIPYTCVYKSDLTQGQSSSKNTLHVGNFGQLLAVSDNCVLYWKKPTIQVYTFTSETDASIPKHRASKSMQSSSDQWHIMCELSSPAQESPWTWVAACVVPTNTGCADESYSGQQGLGSSTISMNDLKHRVENISQSLAKNSNAQPPCSQQTNSGARAKTSMNVVASTSSCNEMVIVLDWGSSKLFTFYGDGTLWYSRSLSYVPAPYKSCAATASHLFVVEYTGRALHVHDLTRRARHIRRLGCRELSITDDEEIETCLGCSLEGVLTLMLNENGVKRLVTFAGFV